MRMSASCPPVPRGKGHAGAPGFMAVRCPRHASDGVCSPMPARRGRHPFHQNLGPT